MKKILFISIFIQALVIATSAGAYQLCPAITLEQFVEQYYNKADAVIQVEVTDSFLDTPDKNAPIRRRAG